MLNDGNWQRSSITKLDIADGIVACKFNKPIVYLERNYCDFFPVIFFLPTQHILAILY
jgi:hypothetical protein